MEDIHIAEAKKNLSKFGFLDVHVDASLDLFGEIERLKNSVLLKDSNRPSGVLKNILEISTTRRTNDDNE